MPARPSDIDRGPARKDLARFLHHRESLRGAGAQIGRLATAVDLIPGCGPRNKAMGACSSGARQSETLDLPSSDGVDWDLRSVPVFQRTAENRLPPDNSIRQ